MNLVSLLLRSGAIYADRPALIVGERQVATFSKLCSDVASLAGFLRHDLRLAPDDTVAIVARNCPEFVEALFACWHAGLVAVPINPRLHAKEIAYILDHCEAKACFVSDDLAELISGIEPELPRLARVICFGGADYGRLKSGDHQAVVERGPDDLAWLFYTSGTTGKPKGAQLTHRNLHAMTCGYFVDYERILPGESILHIGPMCHGSGLYILPHIVGGAAQVIPQSAGLDTAEVFRLIEAHRGIGFFAAPTIVKRLTESRDAVSADTANLRTIVYGGAPMYLEDLKRALACFGPKLAQVYGQGESPMAISVLPKYMHSLAGGDQAEARMASVGYAQSVVEVKIADSEGREAPRGEPGEVLVRGDTVMRGYLKNPDANAATLRGGWLHTGDVAVMDDAGFITLKDRSKDVIISGGANIYPREVEEVLLRHPGVAAISVIGVPDPEWGESVVAVVVAAPGAKPSRDELDALCLDNMARYKRPKTYHFVDRLPQSHIGKTLKRDIRELVSRLDAPPSA